MQSMRGEYLDAGALSIRMASIQTAETGYIPRLQMFQLKRHWAFNKSTG